MMGERDSEPEIQIETVILTGGICPRCGEPNLKSASLCEACDGELTEEIRRGRRSGEAISEDGLKILEEIAARPTQTVLSEAQLAVRRSLTTPNDQYTRALKRALAQLTDESDQDKEDGPPGWWGGE